ncbi:hypothetical protein BAUCODRAFT_461127 [Baudoinia panamericana UAMH 10762]|uniref:Uncharacterized protein n=1 Tax=Baudoinia panamericana (strain UAMH 10762) TaxID=717646 RepID=M2NFA6_BAUPA|nr:uncharacterized protein BAUCODRAFT_461127 [Baudoinia panamericana UAMH 10762]EMC97665.1 hypothetical protein BAUCODRAFT_461127 [Baudoinia panamericana UAMH 10762]
MRTWIHCGFSIQFPLAANSHAPCQVAIVRGLPVTPAETYTVVHMVRNPKKQPCAARLLEGLQSTVTRTSSLHSAALCWTQSQRNSVNGG